jgi:hypothetical protein
MIHSHYGGRCCRCELPKPRWPPSHTDNERVRECSNRPRFGCYSLAHVVWLHRGIISARQDQLKDGIGRMICRSYFLVSISICSSLGRKTISSASRTILCAPVCCAQQRAEMCLGSIRSTEHFGLASTMAFQMR